jgi:hypothetical protein
MFRSAAIESSKSQISVFIRGFNVIRLKWWSVFGILLNISTSMKYL